MGELEVLDVKLAEMEKDVLEEFAKMIDNDASKYKLAIKAGERRILKKLREEEIPLLIRNRTRQ